MDTANRQTIRQGVDNLSPEKFAALEEKQKQNRTPEEIAQEEREKAQAREAYLATSAGAHLQEFINGIAASANTEEVSTGFPAMDESLDGGLYEGLITIGAISSLGKTSLCLQMADQIAQRGGQVLYFSLEMARTELMAKSISRHTAMLCQERKLNTANAKTARGITAGKRYARYTQAEKQLIDDAIMRYKDYAENIFISEGVGDIGVIQIRDTIKKHILYTGQKPAAIFVDYLQILAPYNERATDKQNTDRAVIELKRISRDFKIPVIAISSFNRENYKAAVNLTAFKETGSIEYSSDVVIGLQLEGAGTPEFNEAKEKEKNPRQVELVILKNRQGKVNQKLLYTYYTLFNYFREESKPERR